MRGHGHAPSGLGEPITHTIHRSLPILTGAFLRTVFLRAALHHLRARAAFHAFRLRAAHRTVLRRAAFRRAFFHPLLRGVVSLLLRAGCRLRG